MLARDVVCALQILQDSIGLAEHAVDIGDVLQGIHERRRGLRERWNRQRFLQAGDGPLIFAHALQNHAEVRQIAGDCKFVIALAIDRERPFGDGQCSGVPPFMPAQQPHAAQRVSLQRRIAVLVTHAQGRAECAVCIVEATQQGQQISLAQIRLRELRRCAVRRQQRNQLVDDLLLSTSLAERLAQPFLLQQNVCETDHVVRIEVDQAFANTIEQGKRIRELAERVCAGGSAHAVRTAQSQSSACVKW